MTNMAAEIGGFTGIVAPDEKVVEFLTERRGLLRTRSRAHDRRPAKRSRAPNTRTSSNSMPPTSRPWLPRPATPATANTSAISHTPVPIEIAYGGTCTAGKNEDMDMYAAVLADALKRGLRVSDNVAVLDSVRLAGNTRVLAAQRLHRNFRKGRRAPHRAQLRSLHQRRPRRLHSPRSNRHQRAEPQFPRPQRSGTNVSGLAAHGRRERRGGVHRRIPSVVQN